MNDNKPSDGELKNQSIRSRLNNYLPISLRKNRSYRVFFIFTLVITLVVFQFPMLSGGWDSLFQMLGFFTMILHVFIAGLTSILMRMDKVIDYRKSRLLVSSVLVVMLFFCWTSRMFAEERLLHDSDGIVTEKYQAGNAGMAIKVKGPKGGNFVGINYAVWKEMKIGDHIFKESMNPFGLVNGNEKLLVEKRHWFGFRGLWLPKTAG